MAQENNVHEKQKELIDTEIAKAISMNPKAGKAELKKQLVKTLVRSGHTRARAIRLVKENWGR